MVFTPFTQQTPFSFIHGHQQSRLFKLDPLFDPKPSILLISATQQTGMGIQNWHVLLVEGIADLPGSCQGLSPTRYGRDPLHREVKLVVADAVSDRMVAVCDKKGMPHVLDGFQESFLKSGKKLLLYSSISWSGCMMNIGRR